MAGFSVRNAYYLRVSASSVIPLYLYLDERHVDWMSDTVLQHVLADLRPLVLPKLQAEKDIHFGPGASSGRKGAVDVHRGETYQAAFFFQKTEPHNVIIKTRSFVPAPPPSSKVNIPPPRPEKSKSRSGKRKNRASENKDTQTASGRKRRKTAGRSRAHSDEEDEEEEEEVISLSDDSSEMDRTQGVSRETPATTRRSQRIKKIPVGGYREDVEDPVEISSDESLDVEMAGPTETTQQNEVPEEELSDHDVLVMDHSAEISTTVKQEDTEKSLESTMEHTLDSEAVVITPGPSRPFMEIDDEDDKKDKLALKLKYQGFNIFGRCLCVVVEPWPPIRSATRAPSVIPLTNEALRGSTIAPPDFVPSNNSQRARTPLFLPEFDRGRSLTPTPFPRAKTLPPVPLFNDPAPDSDSDGYGSDDLMIFSQALNAAGGMHVAAADDDDEMDGAVLFGDADEVREFS
ncbi:uncharacterized protein F5891DRAFT_940374 [Suillus fuscotomentosus]|uniref:Uncharacterized protein n=1 Tax=Suillus fuscotomentosus TaxID=1912939 RepID=A0AAD4EJ86_9AGAM|nr:uncharacterized protein F5891DRAFT_940374 [Suillus fuscotomentosus]KAG1907086.1 hypothetical protein F5891DRAFT_940374 [Suillus fuscotomentosus]